MRNNNSERHGKKLLQAWIDLEDYEKIEKIAKEMQSSKGSVVKILVKNIDENLIIFKNKIEKVLENKD